jgi:Ca2+-binding EF-hand superfamily protein
MHTGEKLKQLQEQREESEKKEILRAELQNLSVAALEKRAQQAGIAQSSIQALPHGDEQKSELIRLITAADSGEEPKHSIHVRLVLWLWSFVTSCGHCVKVQVRGGDSESFPREAKVWSFKECFRTLLDPCWKRNNSVQPQQYLVSEPAPDIKSNAAISGADGPPRVRAPPSAQRKICVQQMEKCAEMAGILFDSADKNNSGDLDRSEIRAVLTDIFTQKRIDEADENYILNFSSNPNGITREELAHAIKSWQYWQYQKTYLRPRLDSFFAKHGITITEGEVKLLLGELNEATDESDRRAPTDSEIRWVVAQSQQRGDQSADTTKVAQPASIDRTKLEAAIFRWYTHLHNRRDEDIKNEFAKAASKVGQTRLLVAAQMPLQHGQANALFRKFDTNRSGALDQSQLHRYMEALNGGETVNTWEVRFVLATSDTLESGASAIKPDEIGEAIAMWKCLQSEMGTIENLFHKYGANDSGRLDESQVHCLLTDLNDGDQVTIAETQWVMQAADVNGSGMLSRDELRASVAIVCHRSDCL